MSVELGTQLQSVEKPIDSKYLENLIEEFSASSPTPKEWAEKVAQRLSKKDSRYKFLVLVTEISSAADLNADLSIQTSVAAVWNSDKDGSVTVKVPGDSTKVLSVFWVYAN